MEIEADGFLMKVTIALIYLPIWMISILTV